MVWIENVKSRVPVAITIAGSDSGGGAGVQADLKTFAALGVHGATALTSITAQNTCSVTGVEDVDAEMIRKQITAVAEDIGIDAGKTGMLHTQEIIKAVASAILDYEFPLVVDPVMIAKSGAALLEPDAVNALKEHLIRKATVVTPNRFEAEKLAKTRIRNVEDAKAAAKEISKIGPKAVVVKGGHLNQQQAVDVLYYNGVFKVFKAPKLDVKTTHGTGCSFSAAITAELAKGKKIREAVENAKKLVTLAIRFGLNLGKGYGPVNPMAHLYRESSKYQVLLNVEEAKNLIESSPLIKKLVPEVSMNIAMSIPYVQSVDDVAAVEGRIVRTVKGAKSAGNPKFGCSSHLAKYIIEVTKHDQSKKAAVNIKFSTEILNFLERKGLTTSFYDRTEEPKDVKLVEGMTVPWGVTQAVKRLGKAPDVIYHKGDVGKEPMIVIFGKEATDLAKLLLELAAKVNNHGS